MSNRYSRQEWAAGHKFHLPRRRGLKGLPLLTVHDGAGPSVVCCEGLHERCTLSICTCPCHHEQKGGAS